MKRRSGAGAAATLVAACLFGAALVLSLLSSVAVYRQVQERTDRSGERRLGLSYLTAKLHSCDAEGMVRAGDFHGLDALFLSEREGDTSYETVLYVYDGWLRELFYETGYELEPQDGERITEARNLSVRAVGRLLELDYVDGNGEGGRANVYVRSGD